MKREPYATAARAFFLLTAANVGAALACAQDPAAPTGGGNAATRPCSANPVLAYAPSKKNAKKLKHPPAPEPAPTCIEVKGDALGIQEFLQNLVREQSWRVGENRASEDLWSFVRYFNSDELETYADTKVTIEGVKFSSGKAVTTVRTTDLGGEFVRVQISVHIQGEGRSADPTLKQPATVWPLNSRGALEKELVTALETGYKPLD